MADQADGLRRMVQAQAQAQARSLAAGGASSRARSLVLTSGKGGVGTSNLALNLAIALGELGRRVVLVDADLGLANLDLLCGLTPARDLGDLLDPDRDSDALPLTEGPAGVRIVAGAHAMRTAPEALGAGAARLSAGLAQLERSADLIVIDAGSGLGPAVVALAAAADEVAVVTTPEPTSLADAHAAIGRLRRLPGVRLRALVNQARSTAEARDVLDRLTATSRQFLGAVVAPLGHVRFDPRVPRAVRARTPFLLAGPHSPASRCVRRVARDWAAQTDRDRLGGPDVDLGDSRAARAGRPGFFTGLAARRALGRLAS